MELQAIQPYVKLGMTGSSAEINADVLNQTYQRSKQGELLEISKTCPQNIHCGDMSAQ